MATANEGDTGSVKYDCRLNHAHRIKKTTSKNNVAVTEPSIIDLVPERRFNALVYNLSKSGPTCQTLVRLCWRRRTTFVL